MICFQELGSYQYVPNSKICGNHNFTFCFVNINNYYFMANHGSTAGCVYEVKNGKVTHHDGSISSSILENLNRILSQKIFI